MTMTRVSTALLRLLQHWGFYLPPEVEPGFDQRFRATRGFRV